ncbi:hypothetical protein BH09BAC3_BH09BAC3_31200 [soil metagenome]
MKELITYFAIASLLSFAGCISTEEATVINTKNQQINSAVTPRDFLSAEKYDRLVVEIIYVPGYQPTEVTITSLTSFLQARLNKPGGISVIRTATAAPEIATYSILDAEKIELANRREVTSGKTLTVYFFFANGDYTGNFGNSKVLGIAYGKSSAIIFEKTIRGISGGFSQPTVSTLETLVMQHEFGHVFGLVDNGTPLTSAHLDSSNGKHCTDTGCLMYHNVETSDVIGNLFGGTIPSLTAGCVADLKGNGGK